ncbi:unnamed protein product [Mycena citricolor]|uniref:C2H2-type domain-containing protein n=1 Tax=Mycena citricolor TaxID=2018698 RepID=A0AAD2Q4D6_9AGAR|nr:unnamed protein product [Mycena citricolor]
MAKSSPKKVFQCQFCRRKFGSNRGLKSHTSQSVACHAQLLKTRAEITLQREDSLLRDESPPMSQFTDIQPPADNPPAPLLRVPRVEEIEDEGDLPGPYYDYFPLPAGCVIEQWSPAETVFENLRRKQQTKKLPPWAPFDSKEDWELAKWMVTSGVSRRRLDELLNLQKIKVGAKPSFHNARKLYQKVDLLPMGPEWICEVVEIEGDLEDKKKNKMKEEVEFWRRNPLDCIRELMQNPGFREHLRYEPTKVYRDAQGKEREINEMWTGDWWWKMQELLPEGVTISPVILASDKTQLSRFSGDKQAWPVYLTIGNIPKALRRKPSAQATVLIGYIPVTKMHCFSQKLRGAAGQQFFHNCMRMLLEPLVEAGKNGVEMLCADGEWRLVYPILAAYIADYPEQCLIACCKETRCPQCDVDADERGDPIASTLRDPDKTVKLMRKQADGQEPAEFETLGLRLTEPFWHNLPHCDIFQCFTPDILHQLHKGVFKDHTVSWATASVDLGNTKKQNEQEVDSRFRAMLSHPSLRHFKSGISLVSQWTGNEYKHMEKIFLGVIHGAVDANVICAVRGVLDFIHYAHFEKHTTSSLQALEEAWLLFHAHKDVFIAKGIREHFNIPKIHAMKHYVDQIRSKGTADGFNTELSERLHINYAKMGYNSSNKNGYIQQMTRWLSRREALDRFTAYLQWVVPGYEAEDFGTGDDQDPDEDEEDGDVAEQDELEDGEDLPVFQARTTHYAVAKTAPRRNVTIDMLEHEYGTTDFKWYLQEFLEKNNILPRDFDDIEALFAVYKRVMIHILPVEHVTDEVTQDPVRATPPKPAIGTKKAIPLHFDTVLAHQKKPAGDHAGQVLTDLTPARVRAIFSLPVEYGFCQSR